ncbi:MAG TPA: GNAT family N-acetyltransferase [Pirellulales bacterium]|nr:GNAT family N-acetyltransferase [Pirellulales bacterium]
MGLTYFKRYRMEVSLANRELPRAALPPGYRFIPWEEALLESHAETKYLSFRTEIDANVFPCLGELAGCYRLMNEIRHKDGFLPAATWLLAHSESAVASPEFCGTIQGIRDPAGMGAIQNLGVTPEHRGQGLGRALLLQALNGFQQAGLKQAFLEVTAQNAGAIHLYQQIGFAHARTVYKAVEVAYT